MTVKLASRIAHQRTRMWSPFANNRWSHDACCKSCPWLQVGKHTTPPRAPLCAYDIIRVLPHTCTHTYTMHVVCKGHNNYMHTCINNYISIYSTCMSVLYYKHVYIQICIYDQVYTLSVVGRGGALVDFVRRVASSNPTLAAT